MSGSALERQIQSWLQTHPLFSILEEAALTCLVRELEMCSFAMGQTIVEEGTPGDAVYLVYAGKMRVVKDGPLGKPLTVATLGAGEIFGEHAVLTEEPRSASVRAAEDSVIFRLPRSALTDLLNSQPALRLHLEKLIRFRAFGRFLQQATFLGAVPARQLALLLDQFEECTFQEGQTILREGEANDRLFLLKSGEAKVVKNGEIVLAYLAAGDYFGERALLLQEPRYASVIALSPTECASLSRERFEKLLASAPQVHEQLRRRLEQYQRGEELARRVGVARPVRPEAEPARRLVFEKITERALPKPPRRGTWFGQRYPFVAQEHESDCGAACLAMVARYYGVRLSLEQLRYLTHVGSAGASMLGLTQAAQTVGFACRAVQTDATHLADLPLPAIAHWKGYHYLVLYEAGAHQVTLGDPAEGLVSKARQTFEQDGWTGNLILLTRTPRLGQVAQVPSLWVGTRQLLTSGRGLIAGLLLLSTLVAALTLTIPLLLGQLFDAAVGGAGTHSQLGRLCGWLFLAGLGLGVGLTARRLLLERLIAQEATWLSASALQNLLTWPLPFFQSRPLGDWLDYLDSHRLLPRHDTTMLATAMLNGLLILGALSLAFFWDATLGLLLVAVLLLLGALTFGTLRRARHERSLGGSAFSILVETLRALPSLWGTRAAQERIGEYPERLQAEWIQHACVRRRYGLMFGGATFLLCLASAATLWYAAARVHAAKWTTGEGVAVLTCTGLLLAVLSRLLALIPQALQLADRWRLAADFPAASLAASVPALIPPRVRGFLRLIDVSYRAHPESSPILTHLNLEIEPGRLVWIVGPSGAGKTTLMRLLQRHDTPSEGKILLDGIALNMFDIHAWQACCSMVPQEPAIFAGTIRDNVALEHPEVTLEQVMTAAKLAGAHDFILRLPGAYDCDVGHDGSRLSAGQKQALRLARALVASPRLLVLDEATGLLGTEAEKEVLHHLRCLADDRTILVFTQRPVMVAETDFMVLLEGGQFVARGSPGECGAGQESLRSLTAPAWAP